MLVAPMSCMNFLRFAVIAAFFTLSAPALAGPAVSTGTGDERFTSACITENNGTIAAERLRADLSDQEETFEGRGSGPRHAFDADTCRTEHR